MSVYAKTMSALEQKNDALKKELASEEMKIGFLYLDDAACSKEDRDRYQGLKDEFQQLMATLSDIKGLEAKKKELSDQILNEKNELASLVAKESGLMLTLGIALYGQSGAAEVPSFSKAYEEASSWAEKITASKTQCEQMSDSMELQNVFSRVVTKVKVNSLSLSINSQQKKLDAALIAGAKAVVEAQDLPDALKCSAYETCISFRNEWNMARIQLEALQDEVQNVEVILSDYGKKSAVQEKADAKNAEIETFAFQAGHTFDKKYITRDGEMLTDFPEKYAEGLARVLELRTNLASVNRRLDILQYSEQIDAADRARESMKNEVAENEDKITKLNERIDELAQHIDANAVAAEKLRSHRLAVEQDEGISLDDLLAMGDSAAESVSASIKREAVHIVKKAEKVAEKAAGKVHKAASTVKKAAVRKGADEVSLADPEETEFLGALNAAKASADAGKEKAKDSE